MLIVSMSGVKHCHANKAPSHITHYTWASHGKQAISDSGDITPANTNTAWSPAYDGSLEFDKFLYESLIISFPSPSLWMAPYVRCHMSTGRHILIACLSPLSPCRWCVPCFLLSAVTGHYPVSHVSCVTLHSAINPSQGRGTGFHQLMDGADNNILSSKHTLIQLSSY